MHKFRHSLILLLFCVILPLSHAAIYQWTDAQGQKHYSDSKQHNATPFNLHQDYSYHGVKKVYDGDTIQLTDGRKIRLLAINTPEVAHARDDAQTGGEVAKKWLIKQLAQTKVRLEFDQEKQDKYHRYLAHIFTEQGVHINLELVRLGYASLNIFPPNLKYVTTLLQAEQAAESQQRGIWAYREYRPKSSAQLTKKNSRGWQRIYGKVLSIKHTRKNVYLQLPDAFSIQINKSHLAYFTKLNELKGQQIEARGWVRRYKQGYSMRVRHTSAIKVL